MDAMTDRRLRAFYRESERESVVQQIRPQSRAEWYLIRCARGRDRTAMRWLAARKFGVFLPMKGLKRIASGWLCAYVFDIEAMQDRILSTPGVTGILRSHIEAPLVIDAQFIRNLREQTWIGDKAPEPHKRLKKRAKKRHGRDRKKLRRLKTALKRTDIEHNLARVLDIRAQIGALRQRLSAPLACG